MSYSCFRLGLGVPKLLLIIYWILQCIFHLVLLNAGFSHLSIASYSNVLLCNWFRRSVAYSRQHTVMPIQPFASNCGRDFIHSQVCVCAHRWFIICLSTVTGSQAPVLVPGCCREVWKRGFCCGICKWSEPSPRILNTLTQTGQGQSPAHISSPLTSYRYL